MAVETTNNATMSDVDLAKAFSKIVIKALKGGLSVSEILTQVEAVIEGLNEEDYNWLEHEAA
jgi:hypothetical protein